MGKGGKWEWRVFLRDRGSAAALFASLSGGRAPPSLEDFEEQRTDEYFVTGPSVGLKRRGGGAGGGVECKLRTARKKRGAERWVKQEFPLVEGAGDLAEVRRWVADNLKGGGGGGAGGVDDPLLSLGALEDGTAPRHLVPVAKRRLKTKVGRVNVEITEVVRSPLLFDSGHGEGLRLCGGRGTRRALLGHGGHDAEGPAAHHQPSIPPRRPLRLAVPGVVGKVLKRKTPTLRSSPPDAQRLPHTPVAWAVAVEGKEAKEVYQALEEGSSGAGEVGASVGGGGGGGDTVLCCMGYPEYVSLHWHDGAVGAHAEREGMQEGAAAGRWE